MYNFRTDLALERRDIYQKINSVQQIEGIESTEENINENIKVSRVKITSQNGEQAIGKPIGNYITIDVKKLKVATDEDIQKTAETVTNELKKIIDIHTDKEGEILVVGLGNIYVTPDALGPKVINEIDVTRHIKKYLPQYVEQGTRTVSAISPGVLGTTGIETVEILKGIVENIKPKLLIVIDALASRSIERISSTIQISDTGIVPGAGVGNTRQEISYSSLGIPVIAIGIPTVVEIRSCNAKKYIAKLYTSYERVGVQMKKVVIRDKEIIRKILENKSNCNEITIYLMKEHDKLAIIKTDAIKRRVFIPIEKIRNVIKNI